MSRVRTLDFPTIPSESWRRAEALRQGRKCFRVIPLCFPPRLDDVLWSLRPAARQDASKPLQSNAWTVFLYFPPLPSSLPRSQLRRPFHLPRKGATRPAHHVRDVSGRAWSHDSGMCEPYLHVWDAASVLRACAVNKGAAERRLSPDDLRVPRILHFIKTYV